MVLTDASSKRGEFSSVVIHHSRHVKPATIGVLVRCQVENPTSVWQHWRWRGIMRVYGRFVATTLTHSELLLAVGRNTQVLVVDGPLLAF